MLGIQVVAVMATLKVHQLAEVLGCVTVLKSDKK
jgi:hypothetical protein